MLNIKHSAKNYIRNRLSLNEEVEVPNRSFFVEFLTSGSAGKKSQNKLMAQIDLYGYGHGQGHCWLKVESSLSDY